MGRVKIQMKKIEDRQQRNISFAKRKNGLLKKAYELSLLCDVAVGLIFFSPSGKLFIFDAKLSIEDIIEKYNSQPTYKNARLKDATAIEELIAKMRKESMRSGPNLRKIHDDGVRNQIQQKKIDECRIKLAEVERELGRYLKSPNQWESLAELIDRVELLETTLAKVQSRKKELESK
ncbi:PREDICTED: agamous-like MADS-box protein AGL104 [Camelina sativa]|uniref:Agamous-like MADS-box protein AGL104 n=1 Tax=Camelina sativa TaxID=90675 RepID=A0ABM0UUS7_CAMSA|nr:PREDICTED: agamous-like MADS-box protein AGL104 [Camelina sativa]